MMNFHNVHVTLQCCLPFELNFWFVTSQYTIIFGLQGVFCFMASGSVLIGFSVKQFVPLT